MRNLPKIHESLKLIDKSIKLGDFRFVCLFVINAVRYILNNGHEAGDVISGGRLRFLCVGVSVCRCGLETSFKEVQKQLIGRFQLGFNLSIGFKQLTIEDINVKC